jgi:hypothetical protein
VLRGSFANPFAKSAGVYFLDRNAEAPLIWEPLFCAPTWFSTMMFMQNTKQAFTHATRPSARSLASWHPHRDRLGQPLRLHLSALYSGGGKGGRPQLSSGGEVAYTRAHSSAAGWSMESPEREELSGALLAFDGEAHPHPLQEVPDASAPP